MIPINPESKLSDLYTVIQSLCPSASEAEFHKFGILFAFDCTVYLKNMNEFNQPAKGRDQTIMKLREIMSDKHWRLAGREVLSSSTISNQDGTRIFCETKKRLVICGQRVEPFFETEVATLDDEGLIKELRLYSCWSPIASTIQQVTGKGPYAVADYKAESEK